MIQAIGFDLDGTLIDHRSSASKGISLLFNQKGWEYVGETNLETYWEYLENKHFARYISGELSTQQQRRERILEVIESLGISPDLATLDEFFDEFLMHYQSSWTAFPDVIKTLESLKSLGFRLSILTNGIQTQQNAKLKHLGLLGYFDSILAVENLTAPKPDSRAFAQLCEDFNLNASDVAYVGDDLVTDAIGASKSGLHGIWLNRSVMSENLGETHEIGNLAELIPLLNSISNQG